MAAWEGIARFFRTRTLHEQLQEERAHELRRELRAGERAQGQIDRHAVPRAGSIALGPHIEGDTFPKGWGIGRRDGWLTIDERLLDQHCFILGATGAGKTEAIKRLCREILSNTGRDLFLIDGKGDPELAATVRGLAYAHGRGEVPVVRLGYRGASAPYDAFRGEAEDIYNRLVAMSGIAEAAGDSQYYADLNRELLQLVCTPPVGPPRSFEAVRERLNLDWLLGAWKDDPDETAILRTKRPRDLESLGVRLRPLIRAFAPLIGPEGFALEETGAAVFSLRTQSAGDTAGRFLQFFIEDLKDFAGKRQRRPAVLIIDEFSAFGNRNIIDLLALARSARLGIVLATQDTASLGDRATTQLILANTRTKLLMATDFPEQVATLAGTIYQIESSMQHESGEATGMGSSRPQHAFKIDMNQAARLQAGEGFLIRQRYASKLRIARIETPESAPPERERRRRPERTIAPVRSTAAAESEDPAERDREERPVRIIEF